MVATFSGCSDPDPTGLAEPSQPLPAVSASATSSRYGNVDADSTAVRQVDSLARSFAIAPAEPSARARLVEALRASPADEEHKVFLGQAMSSLQLGTRGLNADLGVIRAIGAPRDFRKLSQEIEVYLPVREQRDLYSGDGPLLVAWQMFEDSAPVAYDHDGTRRILSLDGPPSETVVVLVPRESRLDQVLLNSNCRNESKRSGAIGTWSCAQPGFYLTDAQLNDLREPWTLGTPEITYVVTTMPTFGSQFDTRVSCLSDEPLPTGQFFLDQNTNTQSFAIGGTHMFLNQVQIAQMEAIAAVFGMPTADVKVTVWEDDEGNKCDFDQSNGLALLTAAVNAVNGVVGVFKGFNRCVDTVINPQDSTLIGGANRRFRAVSNLCGLLRIAGLVSTALQVFSGGDDFIGVAEAVSDPALNGGWSHVVVNGAGVQTGRFNITGVDEL